MTGGGPPAVVVGGGAAGLLAAATAARRGRPVTLIERSDRPGRKLLITGKGRCNVTNDCTPDEIVAHVPTNGRFLYSALAACGPREVMALFEGLGVPLKTERGARVFPCSDRAADIVAALVRNAREAGVRFRQGRVTRLLIEDGRCNGVELEDGERLAASAVAVCTGGMSYPRTGSSGDGYALARQAGHTVTPLRPSLVPLTSPDEDCRRMQGLSLRNCGMQVRDNETGKTVYTDFGELLFTHFGVSGPMALSASAHMRQMTAGRYTLLLDLKPALTPEQLDARILRDLGERKNAAFGNALGGLYPRKMIPVMIDRSGVPADRPCNAVTRADRARLGAVTKAFAVAIDGFRPIEEAVVTAGGVAVREVDARTMASRLTAGLYFAGEVLDVDGYTGGYNLQIAFATGAAAGRNL